MMCGFRRVRQPESKLPGSGRPEPWRSDARQSPKRSQDSRSDDSPTATGSPAVGTGAGPRPTVEQTRARQVQAIAAPFDPAYGEKAPVRQVLVSEDEVWAQYGTDDATDWGSRCAECRETVSSWKSPIASCVNCWKVEVWGSSPILHREMDWFDLGEVAETVVRQTGAVIKVSKEPIPVIRSGVPEEGYPKADLDYLLMGYAESMPERDALRQSLCVALSINPSKADLIPVRRGCWFYDEKLGPWTEWYPTDRDMGET